MNHLVIRSIPRGSLSLKKQMVDARQLVVMDPRRISCPWPCGLTGILSARHELLTKFLIIIEPVNDDRWDSPNSWQTHSQNRKEIAKDPSNVETFGRFGRLVPPPEDAKAGVGESRSAQRAAVALNFGEARAVAADVTNVTM